MRNRASFRLMLIMLILLGTIFVLLAADLVTFSFTKLGLSLAAAVALLGFSLIGSVINIPISRRKIIYEEQVQPSFPFSLFYHIPPRVKEQVLAVNVGGALVPTGFSIHLLITRAPIWQTVVATTMVAAIAKLVARPRPGIGIVMPVLVPPLLAVGLALLLSRHNAPPVAYVSGTMGTLIGADLLNFPAIRCLGSHMVSIGGAGVFDGIFLVGIVAALLA
jgi:uncharacterized membrane protein